MLDNRHSCRHMDLSTGSTEARGETCDRTRSQRPHTFHLSIKVPGLGCPSAQFLSDSLPEKKRQVGIPRDTHRTIMSPFSLHPKQKGHTGLFSKFAALHSPTNLTWSLCIQNAKSKGTYRRVTVPKAGVLWLPSPLQASCTG